MMTIAVVLTALVGCVCVGALAAGIERAVADVRARRNLRASGRGPAGSSPAAGPGPAPTSGVPVRHQVHRDHRAAVEAAIEAAWLDYDLYRTAGWLPGEHDYRFGGTR